MKKQVAGSDRQKQPDRIPAVLVTHTHWDREWYQSLDRYRFRLAELFERLFSIVARRPEYHSFWMDGQTIPVRDYLEVCPEKRPAVERLLRSKKLLIGPWYVSADEFMVSGESAIRNLAMGMAEARKYGQENRIGYLADIFGHISQMPQILAGFGIRNAVMWRGFDLKNISRSENIWEGADGTRLLAICLVAGYSNACGVTGGPDADFQAMDGEPSSGLSRLKHYGSSGVLLLLNGVDHALPIPDVAGAIRKIESRFPELKVRHGSLDDYLQAIARKIPKTVALRGELPLFPGLQGNLATRIEQKLAHRTLECLLIHYAEPLYTLARVGGDSRRFLPPAGFLRRAWRLLLENESHDSIDPHVDAVAQDVMARYRKAIEVGEEIVNQSLEFFSGQKTRYRKATWPVSVTLFNPCSWPRTGPFEIAVDFPLDTAGGGIAASLDEEPVPCAVVSQSRYRRIVFKEYVNPVPEEVLRTRLLIKPKSLPSFSLSRLNLRPLDPDEPAVKSAKKAVRPIAGSSGVLDNGLLRVSLRGDGSMDIEDVHHRARLPGLGKLILNPNGGGVYQYARPLNVADGVISSGVTSLLENNPLRGRLQFSGDLVLPSDGECPAVRSPVRMEVGLGAESQLVTIKIEIQCRVPACRIQALFPLPSDMARIRAHTPFDVVERGPVAEDRRLANGTLLDVSGAARVARFFLQAYGGKRSLVVANRGTVGYYWDGQGPLAMTLLEGVTGRPMASEEPGEMDGASAVGTHCMEYALAVLPNEDRIQALHIGYEFNLPVRGLQTFGGEVAGLPGRLIELSQPSWILSGVKPSEERANRTVVRFWNASDRRQSGRVKVRFPFKRVFLAKLDETRLKRLVPTGQGLKIHSGPKEIVTLEFEHVA